MSFDVNVGRSQPVIKPTSNMNNDGGSGGNTGYMMSGRRKKDEKDKKSLFSNESIDSFEMASKLPKVEEDITTSGNSWLSNLINKITK